MASRTQIVCLCEGEKGRSIDPVFIRKLLKKLDPAWLRPWPGNNVIRLMPCQNRPGAVEKLPAELRSCLAAGGHTTLMVWADCDHDCAGPEALKASFWTEADQQGITREQFELVVFIFAKDRLENWIEFLETGKTDESKEGPRVKDDKRAATAAENLAGMCLEGKPVTNMPPSLQWSCKNWKALRDRMKSS